MASFDNLYLSSSDLILSTEEAARQMFALADLHDLVFEAKVNGFSDIGEWDQITGSWSITDGVLSTTGSTGWHTLMWGGDSLGRDATLVVNRSSSGNMRIIFRAQDSDTYYAFGILSSTIEFIKVINGVESSLISLPRTLDGAAEVKVSYYDNRYTTRDDEMWMFASVWIDGEYLISMRDLIDSSNPPGSGFGLQLYYSGGAATLDSVQVPELGTHIDWYSLTEGETSQMGFGRIDNADKIRVLSRFNGEVHLWKPKPRVSTQTISADDTDETVPDLAQEVITHLRMIGAWERADVMDYELMRLYDYRFEVAQDPFLLSQEDCRLEAQRLIDTSLENAVRKSISTPFFPLLEREDVITHNDEDWIISGITMSRKPAETPSQIDLRKYVSRA